MSAARTESAIIAKGRVERVTAIGPVKFNGRRRGWVPVLGDGHGKRQSNQERGTTKYQCREGGEAQMPQ